MYTYKAIANPSLRRLLVSHHGRRDCFFATPKFSAVRSKRSPIPAQQKPRRAFRATGAPAYSLATDLQPLPTPTEIRPSVVAVARVGGIAITVAIAAVAGSPSRRAR